MTEGKRYGVLFLCTGNSARSILAESILERIGSPRFRAFSAGSMPRGEVHPMALEILGRLDYPIAGLRSKSWQEFAGADAPILDFVFTVCDNAADEACPVWSGQPMTAHWGVPDPAVVRGTPVEQHLAFAEAFKVLRRRIEIFCALPLSALDRLSLQQQLDDIGSRTSGAGGEA